MKRYSSSHLKRQFIVGLSSLKTNASLKRRHIVFMLLEIMATLTIFQHCWNTEDISFVKCSYTTEFRYRMVLLMYKALHPSLNHSVKTILLKNRLHLQISLFTKRFSPLSFQLIPKDYAFVVIQVNQPLLSHCTYQTCHLTSHAFCLTNFI